jgi:D-beta-D-heptose 7-phosphate kinase/D-beta-D-heptose 1-phosphate adenosyltransferase
MSAESKSMSAPDLIAALAGLGRPRILVLGDLILDRYVTGEVDRISPEAPIPVLRARHQEDRLGGAGNVAANLRAMEAGVEVVGLVGEDGLGERMRALLADMGIGTGGLIVDPTRPTTEKTRVVAGSQQLVRVDWEDSRAIDAKLTRALLEDLEARLRGVQAVILSDYGKGVLTKEVLAEAIRLARARALPILVDPKGSDWSGYRGATLVTPNRKEAEEALGRAIRGLDELPSAGKDLIERAELEAVVVTLGPQGMFHLTRAGQSRHVPTVARSVFDVTGAGDTVISHLALGLGAGLSLGVAAELSNYAAGIVVGKRGAASVTRAELFRVLEEAAGRSGEGRSKVLTPAAMAKRLAEWRAQSLKVVLTNGCFDVLHAGHVEYLRFARAQGDVLVVAVNDDESVRRLKGVGRPVNPLADRMAVLSGLEVVDAVISFGDDTPARVVEQVSPAVLVKGEDWRDKGVVGREWVEAHGGKVVLAPLLAGRSTTGILDRARGPSSCG